MSGLKVWPVVLALLLASPPAKGEEPSFELPHNPMFEKIPGGRGIEFFYGEWVMLSGTNHTPYLKIGPGKMTWEERGEAPKPWNWPDRPYRVLEEGPNYVLLLVSHMVLAEVGEKRTTSFVILIFRPFSDPHFLLRDDHFFLNYQEIMEYNLRIYPFDRLAGIHLDYPYMRYHYCGYSDLHGNGEMMSWTRDNILQAFLSSHCRKGLHSEPPTLPFWDIGRGWSSTPYLYTEKKNPPMNLDIQQLMDGYGPTGKSDG